MTVRVPRKTIGDRILRALGKRRAVHAGAAGAGERFGPHADVVLPRESFWRALIRPWGAAPPEGFVYPPGEES